MFGDVIKIKINKNERYKANIKIRMYQNLETNIFFL